MTIITPLPTAPSRQDPATFAARADAFVAALPTLVSEINAAGGVNVGNATTLLGATWAAPGAIGSTTPSTGAFTTLSAGSGKVSVTTAGELYVKGSSGFPSTPNNGDAGIVGNSGNGIVLQGKGSSADFLVLNRNGDSIMYTGTGTRNISFAGNVTAYGGLISTAYGVVISGGSGYDYMQVTSTNGVDMRMVAYGAGNYAQLGTQSAHDVQVVANNYLCTTFKNGGQTITAAALGVKGASIPTGFNGSAVFNGNICISADPSITFNTYYDGAFKYVGNGYGVQLALSADGLGDLGFYTGGNNVSGAGAAFTPAERFRITNGGDLKANGNLLLTATSGSNHILRKTVSTGVTAVEISGNASNASAVFQGADATGWNAASSAFACGKIVSTGRSISAGGTINASGADYAEYEVKAPGCGPVAKGQIVGYDTAGRITDKWADAISFGVKSTDPSYVGGDAWGNEAAVGAAPVMPQIVDGAYSIEEGFAYWEAKAEWDAKHEAARVDVDRIAYAGKVPVNVQGAAPGDYIIPVKSGDGIAGVAVKHPTLDQYLVAVGQVRAILPDGRANIAVKVT